MKVHLQREGENYIAVCGHEAPAYREWPGEFTRVVAHVTCKRCRRVLDSMVHKSKETKP